MNIDRIASSMLRKNIVDAVTKMQQKPGLSLAYDHLRLSNLLDSKIKFSGMVTASGDGGAMRFSFKGLFDRASQAVSDFKSIYRGGMNG